jgi:hypothetical protein
MKDDSTVQFKWKVRAWTTMQEAYWLEDNPVWSKTCRSHQLVERIIPGIGF